MLNQLQSSKQARQSTNNQLNQFQGFNVARCIQFPPFLQHGRLITPAHTRPAWRKTFQGNGGTSRIISSYLQPIRVSTLASVTTHLPAVHPALSTTTATHRLPLWTYKSIREHVVNLHGKPTKQSQLVGKGCTQQPIPGSVPRLHDRASAAGNAKSVHLLTWYQ